MPLPDEDFPGNDHDLCVPGQTVVARMDLVRVAVVVERLEVDGADRRSVGHVPLRIGSDTPTLLVRPLEPTPAMAAAEDGHGWRTSWPVPHDVEDVPGDRLTMMHEHAQTTASAIRAWIDARTAEGDQ